MEANPGTWDFTYKVREDEFGVSVKIELLLFLIQNMIHCSGNLNPLLHIFLVCSVLDNDSGLGVFPVLADIEVDVDVAVRLLFEAQNPESNNIFN